MGRKKKSVSFQFTDAANEDKASNASSEMKTSVEKLHPHAKEDMNVDNNGHQISNGAKGEKNSRAGSVVVRRSTRIKSLASSTNRIEVERVVEHVDLVENEKEQDPEVQRGSNPPEANGRSLEEKVDYLVGAADYFKSKVYKREDVAPSPDISYKNLYISSQKKIESLIEDNYELVRKLEFALGKIAAYEVMKDALGAQKEFVLVSDLAKAAGATASLSPKAVQKSTSSPPATASPNVHKQKKRRYQKRARC